MEKIQQAKGQVTAPADGVVTDRNVQTGGITDDSSYLILGTGGLQIKGSLKLQNLEKVEPEDTVEITVSGQGKKLQGKGYPYRSGKEPGRLPRQQEPWTREQVRPRTQMPEVIFMRI